MTKLNPKKAKFCPGCKKSLNLGKAPELIVKEPEVQTTSKIVTLIGNAKKKASSAINSLF